MRHEEAYGWRPGISESALQPTKRPRAEPSVSPRTADTPGEMSRGEVRLEQQKRSEQPRKWTRLSFMRLAANVVQL